jgi:hypothetical protein
LKLSLIIGKFRSKDTARLAIQKLGEHGFLKVSFHQIDKTPTEGMDSMSNAYAGELPLQARGILGSDIAIEGRTAADIYDKEAAKRMMGGDTKPPNAYAVVVNVTDSENPHFAEEILAKNGADTETHLVDVTDEGR